MTNKVFDSQRMVINLLREIASGGEGSIWETSRNAFVAKLYHSPDPVKKRKLEAMISNRPDNPSQTINHVSIAWPLDLLTDEKGNFKGFLMPTIKDSVPLVDVYNHKIRNKLLPDFNWKYLHVTAKNIALVIHHIHQKGHVLGDIQPKNILVNNKACISVVDTDSFQITDPKNNTVYRCSVASREFTPPELINKDLQNLKQTKAHDRYRLSVMIYHLLFGYHPFQPGTWVGSPEEEPKSIDERIFRGLWLYGQNRFIQEKPNASTYTIPLDVVHPKIKEYFLKCFNDGHFNPSLRPSAKDWYEVLDIAITDLIPCTKFPKNHFYSRTSSLISNDCYWCKRAEKLDGNDIFLLQTSQASTSTTPTSTTYIGTKPESPISCLILIIVGFIAIIIFFAIVSANRSTPSRKESNLHPLTTKSILLWEQSVT